MTRNFTHLLRDVLVYGLGSAVARAATLITLPVYTRIFSPSDYGMFNYTIVAVGLIGLVAAPGGAVVYSRHFFAAKDADGRTLVTSSWAIFLIVWLGILALAAVPFSGQLSLWAFGTGEQRLLVGAAILYLPVSLINGILAQGLRNEFRSTHFVTMNLVGTGLEICLGLLAVLVLKIGLAGIMDGMLAAGLIMLPLRAWMVRSILRMRVSFSLIRNMLRLGAGIAISGLAYWIFMASDRVLLGRLSTFREVGLYSVAATMANALYLVLDGFSQAWTPHIMHLYERDREATRAFIGRTASYLMIAVGILAVGVSTFAGEIVRLLASSTFSSAATVVAPLALGLLAYASTQFTAIGMSLTMRVRRMAIICWETAVVNAALNVALIPRFGMVGSAWATTVSFTFLTISYGFASYRLYPIVYEVRRLVLIVATTSVFVVASGFLPDLSLATAVLLKLGYFSLYIGALFLTGSLNRSDVRDLFGVLRLSSRSQ